MNVKWIRLVSIKGHFLLSSLVNQLNFFALLNIYSLRSLKTISSVSEPYLLMTVQLYVPKYLRWFSSMRSVDLIRSYSTSCRNENPKSLLVSIKMPLNAHETCFALGTVIAMHSISYVSLSNGCCWVREIIFGGPFSMTNASELISGKPLLWALQ